VYASSARAHREDAEVDPIDTYGTSKALAEQALRRFAAATGVTVHIARLFNVYGPGETNPHVVPTVFQQAKDGDVLQLGNLATERDYVFLDDVVDALLRMSSVRSPSRMTTVNVGTGAGLTGAAMVDAIAAVLGRELVVRTTASRMRRSDRSRLVADADYACQLLEWKARTRLEDGLRQCAARPVASGRMPSLDSTATL
jgi:UDP-glucose 4-epimerase